MNKEDRAIREALAENIAAELTQLLEANKELFKDRQYPTTKANVYIYNVDADLDEDVAKIDCGDEFYYRWVTPDTTALYTVEQYDRCDFEDSGPIYVDIDNPNDNYYISEDVYPILPGIKEILDKYLMK